jgi:hypothetical protein
LPASNGALAPDKLLALDRGLFFLLLAARSRIICGTLS